MFILWGVHREHFLYFSLCNIGQKNVRLIIIVTITLVLLILIIININIVEKNLMKGKVKIALCPSIRE